MKLQIGKLYNVSHNYDLLPTPSWEPIIYGVINYRKNTLIIPLEIQTQDGNEDKFSIKVLTQTGKTGWLLAWKHNISKYLTLISLPPNK